MVERKNNILSQRNLRKQEGTNVTVYFRSVTFRKLDGTPSNELAQIQLRKKNAFGEAQAFESGWVTLGNVSDVTPDVVSMLASVITGEKD